MSGKSGVFICPQCQAVVHSDKSLNEGVVCGECNHEFGKLQAGGKSGVQVPMGKKESSSGSVVRDLTAKKSRVVSTTGFQAVAKVAAKPIEQARVETAGIDPEDEMIMPDGSRRVRRRKKRPAKGQNKALILFLFAWLLAIVFVFFLFSRGGEEVDDKPDVVDADGMSAIDREILQKSVPQVSKLFKEFLGASTHAERLQFIDRSSHLSSIFSQHYIQTGFPKAKSKIQQVGANVLRPAEGQWAVETIWVDEDNNRWGALHIFDKAEGWKLDWENFAPLSSEPWAKFRARLGSNEGVFRLLVRKRDISSEAKNMSLSFYRSAGVFEKDDEYANTESPAVDILTDSDLGREFRRLWDDHVAGNAPMGSILGKALDPKPKDLMRITVRLGWGEDQLGEPTIVLKEILGPGWFGERIREIRKEVRRVATEEALKKLSDPSNAE